jgi:hypothetical protein
VNLLNTLKTLILGETWLLPLGVGLVVGVGAATRTLAGQAWRQYGALALPAAIAILLSVSVALSARR